MIIVGRPWTFATLPILQTVTPHFCFAVEVRTGFTGALNSIGDRLATCHYRKLYKIVYNLYSNITLVSCVTQNSADPYKRNINKKSVKYLCMCQYLGRQTLNI